LLDAVLESAKVSDEVIGFHCQQAAEKLLKALLSELGVTYHKNLDILTPFGAVYRYDDYDGTESLNRAETRALLSSLRAWVEERLRSRTILEAT
jgi:HEPN domain-containing protein